MRVSCPTPKVSSSGNSMWVVLSMRLVLFPGSLEAGDALNDPEHCDGADGIRRNQLGPARELRSHAPRGCDNGKDDDDEQNLSYLDADIEKEQSGGNVILRQADFTERAGKTEAVQQAKGERHDPWRARRDSFPSLSPPNNFKGHENDGKGNRGFDRLRWNVHESKRGQRQRDAVRNSESRHCLEQSHSPVGDNEQSQNKKEMIDAEPDVLSSEQGVSCRYREQ